ncbi:Rrf2 family transcriptional regulator [Vagococcus silagei]
MKYSKATDYALHTMLLMAKDGSETSISVVELADKQKVSPTYLSKILTKLSKEGLVASASGAKGGYKLSSNWESISFLDIIQAIEGRQSLFDCYLHEDPNCTIKKIMTAAEEEMENTLKKQTLGGLLKQ